MMIFLSSVVALLLGLSYLLVIYFVITQWEKMPVWEIPAGFRPDARVSVLVPARNEADNILVCLQSLFQQNYPPDLLEILVIDDHSTDGTAELVGAQSHPALQLLRVPKGSGGKKAAITYAVSRAQGELILTTDADCRVPADWIAQLVSCYQTHQPVFITAPVVFTAGPHALQRFQALDMLGTMLITGAGIRSATILMSNGANLAYPKAVFEDVGGFAGIDQLASGDDMLLMHKLAQRYPGRIAFLKNANAAVITPAVDTWPAFFQQRLRWATKSGTYQDGRIIAVLALVFFLCWAIILSPLLILFYGWDGLLPLLILFSCKVWADHKLLSRATGFFGRPELMRYFWPSQWLHIAYIAGIGLLANIFRRYEWKGRRLR